MGFSDDHNNDHDRDHDRAHDHTDNNETRSQKRSPVAGRYIAVAILAAVVGSGSTLVMLPLLRNSGALSVLAPNAITSLTGNDTSAVQVSTPIHVNVTDGITQAVKKVQPAVVGVVNYGQVSDFFSQQPKLQATGVGTGVLFYKDKQVGYMVTNNHVVEGAAKVEVVLGSGKHVQASVVGTDLFTDLAVLKVPQTAIADVAPAQFANSDLIQAGEPAIAIGTPLGLDFADSVTAGIVSATKRIMPVQEPQTQQVLDYQAVIQTDAAINPGNSGGPLLNINGQVIGINSSKIVAPEFEGMGFAIPSNEARNIAEQIMQTGHAVHPSLGVQGYSLASLPEQMWPDVPVDYGVWVKGFTTPEARSSGLRAQDVIVGIDGHDVKSMADLRTYLFQVKPAQVVTLRVYRGPQQLSVKVKLGTMESSNTTNVPSMSSGDGSDTMESFSDSPSTDFRS
ncbi:MAG: peptidase S1 [Alicyclobacillus sp. RIFOXYA1_FULL_53_8]|nr:MAG: peptidase S1 [Alicyclobacillus sp. RIFOXYA1_FULL_53_8]